MSKNIYLTFDIETIVSKLSYNPTFYASVIIGALDIAWELKRRDLKGTFYISLSPKVKEINFQDYINGVEMLVNCLKSFDNIKIEPHIHAFNLPMNFSTNEDKFSAYSHKEQTDLLNWARGFFANLGVAVSHFRPGSYSTNSYYYDSLQEANFKTSSILQKDKVVNIDMIKDEILETPPYFAFNKIKEYPVTSVKIKSIKNGKTEVINLSPDFLTIESVSKYIEKLEYVNINFHSFSMYNNRLARENHKTQFGNNVKFLLLEKWTNYFLRKVKIETINHNTIFKKEFIKWLDYIEKNKYNTSFIGE